jgi:hypothetical protein
MLKKNNILIAVFIVILLIFLFIWINYLVQQKYIVECFTTSITQDRGNPDNTHTVNLPLTTTFSCKNFCGPTARCSITSQQCTADIDCPGCQPYSPPLSYLTTDVRGENDAGKLTVGETPTFSTLTTDIGTQAKVFYKNQFKEAPQANFGVDTWRNKFNIGEKLFKRRYECDKYPYKQTYPKRFSDTGMFLEDGPLAANAYLN